MRDMDDFGAILSVDIDDDGDLSIDLYFQKVLNATILLGLSHSSKPDHFFYSIVARSDDGNYLCSTVKMTDEQRAVVLDWLRQLVGRELKEEE